MVGYNPVSCNAGWVYPQIDNFYLLGTEGWKECEDLRNDLFENGGTWFWYHRYTRTLALKQTWTYDSPDTKST